MRGEDTTGVTGTFAPPRKHRGSRVGGGIAFKLAGSTGSQSCMRVGGNAERRSCARSAPQHRTQSGSRPRAVGSHAPRTRLFPPRMWVGTPAYAGRHPHSRGSAGDCTPLRTPGRAAFSPPHGAVDPRARGKKPRACGSPPPCTGLRTRARGAGGPSARGAEPTACGSGAVRPRRASGFARSRPVFHGRFGATPLRG